jgi:hypothetical protein
MTKPYGLETWLVVLSDFDHLSEQLRAKQNGEGLQGKEPCGV